MPPAIALSFGAAIVGFALLGKNAAPAAEAAVAEPAPVDPAEVPAPIEEPAPAEEELPAPEASAPSAAEGYDRLPDGSPVPELPKTAPRTIKFGVILFEYEGAQAAPGQNNARARTKADAQALARATVSLAKTDFGQAVDKGDRGSTANAGSIPRGVLEPSVEYVLFTLEKGSVHPEPIETPRGYWIVRRIQ